MAVRDYYDILGIPKNASEEDIKKAYRKLAMKYHPDRNQGETAKKAEELFKEAKEAYEILSHPSQRAAYDNYGHEAVKLWREVDNTGRNADEVINSYFGQNRTTGRGHTNGTGSGRTAGTNRGAGGPRGAGFTFGENPFKGDPHMEQMWDDLMRDFEETERQTAKMFEDLNRDLGRSFGASSASSRSVSQNMPSVAASAMHDGKVGVGKIVAIVAAVAVVGYAIIRSYSTEQKRRQQQDWRNRIKMPVPSQTTQTL